MYQIELIDRVILNKYIYIKLLSTTTKTSDILVGINPISELININVDPRKV